MLILFNFWIEKVRNFTNSLVFLLVQFFFGLTHTSLLASECLSEASKILCYWITDFLFFGYSDLIEIGRRLKISLVQKRLFRLVTISSAISPNFYFLSLTMSFLQIRSHAQKYFLKVQKNGTVAHVPPPRPKRKAAHPYPQKASKNGLVLFHTTMVICSLKAHAHPWHMLFSGLAVLVPLPASMAYVSSISTLPPGYATWDEDSLLMNAGSNKSVPCQDELTNLHGNEGMHISFCS